MAKLVERDSKYYLELSAQELSNLGFQPNCEYDVVQAKSGIWLLTERVPIIPSMPLRPLTVNPLDEKIIALLKKTPLPNRVEKRFEKLLTSELLFHFKQMLSDGKIVLFKLSGKYKRAIYKSSEELREKHPVKKLQVPTPAHTLQPNLISIPSNSVPLLNFPLFDRDGFTIIENDSQAKEFSQKNYDLIKSGKILGLKSFDRKYYVIKADYFSLVRSRFMNSFNSKKSFSLHDISSTLNLNPILSRTLCEFLKDQGDLLEKKRDQFELIK